MNSKQQSSCPCYVGAHLPGELVIFTVFGKNQFCEKFCKIKTISEELLRGEGIPGRWYDCDR